MNKQDKIYVAGHNGLVGSAIVRKLKEQGFNNLIYGSFDNLDLRDQAAVEHFFQTNKPDFVFLAAAKVGGIHANSHYPAEFIYDNLMIEANVVHAAHQTGVQKLLFLGSSCIYPRLSPQPIKEEYLLTGELEPTNEPYAIAKIAGIKLCEYYNKQYGDNFISAMPTNLFGPGDNYHLENSHVLPAMIRKTYLAKLLQRNDFAAIEKNIRLHEGLNLTEPELVSFLERYGVKREAKQVSLALWGTGTPRREFLYVDDLAEALLFLMENYNGTQHVNVGTGEDVTIKEAAQMIKEKINFDGELKWDSSKPDGTPQKLLNIKKIKDLGWKPKHTFAQALQLTIDGYLSLFDPNTHP
ncbi:MAG: GDP-L-fucose synthase [Candidatus Cloacimonetes bacterium]|nr:GDP-L-fucose synthase [Candidatus Cloacimonadota bacterium]